MISGALYHLVLTYSVNGGLDLISLANPKSINLTFNKNNLLIHFELKYFQVLNLYGKNHFYA